ncbi:excinuclease ABC subunit UvrB [Candidatus Dojkabacteria bacterium]|uniref:UvrABC system protein B n=1 Tax=Candidatus Dojkabacteria bacterium TaxID=2099670 RepID=A0A955L350_9BACT|nr:excinuclease ABC subunit UvrB [Candidatus Dojkabacteria bacterium]
MDNFSLVTKYSPSGDQPKAIADLTNGLEAGIKHQTLLGVTGSGKTFSIANVIQNVQKPTLVLAHNKTLAAQLFSEFRDFFPNNAVKYFVSYYDYYQPEAYIPKRDLYIEKEADINKEIEKYRNAATQSLLSRKDVIIVASVSCIYGLGNPEDYLSLSRNLIVGESYQRSKLFRWFTDLQFQRSEYDFEQGYFRVRGETVDIFPASEDNAIRLSFFGDELESIKVIDPLTGEILEEKKEIMIFPAKQFVTPFEALKNAIPRIQAELKEQVAYFKKHNKEIEAYRLKQRVEYDIEMLEQTGYCSGIENYSRFIDNREPGDPPSTLLDYFPDDWLLVVDESHIALPQVRGMYNGDRSRKSVLVDYGFRLPAAKDNRPLTFEEFSQRMNQTIYTSATPNEFELSLSKSASAGKIKGYSGVTEQIARPTGLLDPVVTVRKSENQIDDVLKEVRSNIKDNERVMITTLTKKMAEELTTYLKELDIKVQYVHSDVETVERVEILRDLRLGVYDVIVGVNLLREGIDLPEASLMLILDADKEGFLRSEQALVQLIGRAARHLNGRVILYADKVTKSMKNAMRETERRRKLQAEYNEKYGITPKSIKKDINEILHRTEVKEEETKSFKQLEHKVNEVPFMKKSDKQKLKKEIEGEMLIAADMLEFELAAKLRDLLNSIK